MEQNIKKKKIKFNQTLKNNFTTVLKKEKENAIKEPKSLATRKCSEMTLSALTKKKII